MLLYKVKIFGSYLDLAIWVLLANLVFLNLGFIIASVSKTSQSAEALSQIITMPMMFLSGVFFSTETLPKTIGQIVEYLPLTPIIDALRKIVIEGSSLSATNHELVIVGIWVLATFVLASFIFNRARE